MEAAHEQTSREIISTLVRDEYFDGECDKYYLEGFDGRRRHSAISRCKFLETANLIFSLPTVTENIYVTITDGDPSLIAQVMATLEDMELTGEVALGNVKLFEDAALRKHGVCGVLLLNADLFPALHYLDASVPIVSVDYKFISVVFLTDEDHAYGKAHGHDALMDYFVERQKDVYTFGD